MPTVGKRLSRVRKEKGISAQELADKCFVSESTISHTECSDVAPRCIRRIAKELQVNVAWLHYGDDYATMKIPT